jgi:nucleotide-binding universal stress UspA family protein
MITSAAVKQMVVFLDASSASDARLDVALHIAAAHGAFLVGAYVTDESILGRHPDEFARGAGIAAVVGRESATEDADAARVARRFADRTGVCKIDSEWRTISKYGTAADVILLARHADLSVVGQSELHESTSLWRPEDLLFAFGGPTLIVPRDYASSNRVGRKIMIAWDSSREAKRAVADAMPFLIAAVQVIILTVDPPGAMYRLGESAAALQLRLGRHGIETTVCDVDARGRNIGRVIIDQAKMLDADLIVMGAFGHMRVIEMVFGGATRTVLGHMAVPVLMSH